MQEQNENSPGIRHSFSERHHEKPGTYIIAVAMSLVIHILFFGMCLLFSSGDTDKAKKPHVINVDLLYFPVPERKPEKIEENDSEKTEKISGKIQKKREQKAEKIKKPVYERKKSVTQKKSNKHVLKPKEILKQARKELEKQIEETKPDPLATRISQLKQEILRTDSLNEKKNNEEVIAEKSDNTGSRVANIRDRYLEKARYTIRDRWTYPKNLANSDENLEVNINVTIMPSGEIIDTWFVKRSGNSHFDRSVSAAVMKSNPLPPFPPGLTDPSVPVTLSFTLKDFMSK
jgi:colicin import membrane protein